MRLHGTGGTVQNFELQVWDLLFSGPKLAHLGPVYTGLDKFLHGSTLRLHGTGGTGRIFERLSVQVWDLKALFYTGPDKFLHGQKLARTVPPCVYTDF